MPQADLITPPQKKPNLKPRHTQISQQVKFHEGAAGRASPSNAHGIAATPPESCVALCRTARLDPFGKIAQQKKNPERALWVLSSFKAFSSEF
jgi:hypothetical protein